MAFSVQDLQNLDNAIKTGRRRVKYADKEVEYRSMAEMMEARSFIQGELEKSGQLSSSSRTSNTSFASFGRD
ncbi:hypothetical protein SAMN06265795_12234 [Noviherbaspirillum humi]|uniref:Uncharacterized protein n=1 Tax=Noviherbaspirillum humi TaxID=1688639 RepID=A0A239LEX9_9BURK|nr:hypothetical protein [Noviherbaspirillum humi]SNT28860.1 hypothetical protein SAMN06265795_12234 [Noviherbaspirillum humi]